MIISFSASVTGINTLLSKKFAWKINDLSTENLLDPVLNYTEKLLVKVFHVILLMITCETLLAGSYNIINITTFILQQRFRHQMQCNCCN